jgi:NitT/TauT family transport system substrate-binding protein
MSRWWILAVLAVSLAITPIAPVGGAAPSQPVAGNPVAMAAEAPAPAVAAAAPDPAPLDQGLETIRVGIIGNATDATFFLAQERGYLREVGLDVETTQFNSANLMVAPLGAGQLDVGGGAPGAGLFNAIARGVNVRIVGDRARAVAGTRFNCLTVRKSLLDSGAVRDFADLRGRVFAENAPGVITTYVMERELQRVGLGLQDVNTTVMGFPDFLTAYANDAIDFGFLVEPFITVGEQRGVLQCWRPTSDLEPDFQIAVVLYGPGFADQRPDSARRFTLAHMRAMRDYYRAFFGDGQGRDDLLQVIARIMGSRDFDLLARLAPSWMDPNGGVNVASLRDIQRWYLGRGEQTGEVDFDRVVDMSFVNYANDRLGRYPAP